MQFTSKFKLMGLALAFALGPGGAALAAQPPLGKNAYKAEKERIAQQAKAQRKACDRLKDSAKDLCQAEVKAREKTAQALLEARREPTPEGEKEAKIEIADAEYDLAKARCAAAKGKTKDVCLRRASAEREAAIRLAKVEKVEEVNELKAKAEGREPARKPAPKS